MKKDFSETTLHPYKKVKIIHNCIVESTGPSGISVGKVLACARAADINRNWFLFRNALFNSIPPGRSGVSVTGGLQGWPLRQHLEQFRKNFTADSECGGEHL
jgi:hypothetical protein